MELIMLMGPQAAGKTTWTKNFLIQESENGLGRDWMVISSDQYWTRNPKTNKRVWLDEYNDEHCWETEPIPEKIMAKAWRYAYHRFLFSLQSKHCILFEATFPRRRDRKKIIDLAEYWNYRISCVCLYPKLCECATRNETRPDRVPDVILAKTYANIQIPTKDEGFSEVTIIGAGSKENI